MHMHAYATEVASTRIWHWTRNDAGFNFNIAAGFNTGTVGGFVPAGHTLQRLIGWWSVSGLAFDSGLTENWVAVPFSLTLELDVIGEPNGPRLIYVETAYCAPTYVQQTSTTPVRPYVAAYEGHHFRFDIAVRVQNPNVNEQPINISGSWAAVSVQDGIGIIGLKHPAGVVSLTFLALTTTPRST